MGGPDAYCRKGFFSSGGYPLGWGRQDAHAWTEPNLAEPTTFDGDGIVATEEKANRWTAPKIGI